MLGWTSSWYRRCPLTTNDYPLSLSFYHHLTLVPGRSATFSFKVLGSMTPQWGLAFLVGYPAPSGSYLIPPELPFLAGSLAYDALFAQIGSNAFVFVISLYGATCLPPFTSDSIEGIRSKQSFGTGTE